MCNPYVSPFSKMVALPFSFRSLYQYYSDLESDTHFNCPLSLLPFILWSTVNHWCFTKGLVTSPSSFPTHIPSVSSNPIGKKSLIMYIQAFITQYYRRKTGKDLKIVYKKLTSSLATKHYYCVISTKCEISMICYVL